MDFLPLLTIVIDSVICESVVMFILVGCVPTCVKSEYRLLTIDMQNISRLVRFSLYLLQGLNVISMRL